MAAPPRPRLELLPGGAEGSGDHPRAVLRLVTEAAPPAPATPARAAAPAVALADDPVQLQLAIAEAVEAARQMRLEIERRIALALESWLDHP